LKKFVALFDAHVGWVKVPKNGKLVNKKSHNPQALKAALRFIDDFAPDIAILGGDQINCGPVSHWNDKKPRNLEGLRLKDEYDECDELLISKLLHVKTKHWLTGNHEVWVDKLITTHTGLEGLISPNDYLELTKRGWQVHEQYAVVTEGHLNWTHGERAKGEYHAKKMWMDYKCCIRYGHLHGSQVYLVTSLFDKKFKQDAKCIPCMCDLNYDYSYNQPHNHINGFNYGYIFPDGTFTDYVVTMINNKFVVNNKIYDGKQS
jgi:hypothetical protein